MSMIILLIVMVSVSFTSNEENLISNMEGQDPDPDQQVRRIGKLLILKVHLEIESSKVFNIGSKIAQNLAEIKNCVSCKILWCDTVTQRPTFHSVLPSSLGLIQFRIFLKNFLCSGSEISADQLWDCHLMGVSYHIFIGYSCGSFFSGFSQRGGGFRGYFVFYRFLVLRKGIKL